MTIHNEYAQENPRINRQDRRKVTFPGSAYPKEISQQCTPATHREAVHCQGVLLGVFHPCLWQLKAPGSTLGEGRQTLVSPLTPLPPGGRKGIRPKLLQCTKRSPPSVGTLEPLDKGINDIKFRLNLDVQNLLLKLSLKIIGKEFPDLL